MPPTPSAPLPTPTQVVQLQLPNDVLERLTPHTSWVSQFGAPIAAVLTAVGALTAAIIAYRAATRTINAADERAEGDRDAVVVEARRAEKRDALMAMSDSVLTAKVAVFDLTVSSTRPSEVTQEMTDALAAVRQADLRVAWVHYFGCESVSKSAKSVLKSIRALAVSAYNTDVTSDDRKSARNALDLEITALQGLIIAELNGENAD